MMSSQRPEISGDCEIHNLKSSAASSSSDVLGAAADGEVAQAADGSNKWGALESDFLARCEGNEGTDNGELDGGLADVSSGGGSLSDWANVGVLGEVSIGDEFVEGFEAGISKACAAGAAGKKDGREDGMGAGSSERKSAESIMLNGAHSLRGGLAKASAFGSARGSLLLNRSEGWKHVHLQRLPPLSCLRPFSALSTLGHVRPERYTPQPPQAACFTDLTTW
jgi:hypothetical protein